MLSHFICIHACTAFLVAVFWFKFIFLFFFFFFFFFLGGGGGGGLVMYDNEFKTKGSKLNTIEPQQLHYSELESSFGKTSLFRSGFDRKIT